MELAKTQNALLLLLYLSYLNSVGGAKPVILIIRMFELRSVTTAQTYRPKLSGWILYEGSNEVWSESISNIKTSFWNQIFQLRFEAGMDFLRCVGIKAANPQTSIGKP